MKKFVTFLLLLLLCGVACAAFLLRAETEKISEDPFLAPTLLRENVEKFLFTAVPRDARVFLFTHLPRLVAKPYLCAQILTNGTKQTIFPGDLIGDGLSDAPFRCPGGLEGLVKMGSLARLLFVNGQPEIHLLRGQMETRFWATTTLFTSPYFSFTIKNSSPQGNRLHFSVEDHGAAVGCVSGMIEAEMATLPAGEIKSQQLMARDCLFSLKKEGMPAKHLLPGDIVEFGKLDNPRAKWPTVDAAAWKSLGLTPPAAITAHLEAVDPRGIAKLSWNLPAPAGALQCFVYAQENTRQAPTIAAKFSSANSGGSIPLPVGAEKKFLSLLCNGSAGSHVSNTLAPAPEPAPPPTTTAPPAATTPVAE